MRWTRRAVWVLFFGVPIWLLDELVQKLDLLGNKVWVEDDDDGFCSSE